MQQQPKDKKRRQGLLVLLVLFSSSLLLSQTDEWFVEDDLRDDTTQLPDNQQLVQLVEVIDGDTVKINYEDETVNARLLLVDTPENSTTKTGHAQPYGEEAKQYLENLLEGTTLSIAFEPTHDDRDQFNRLLVYLFADEILVQTELLRQGYARLGYENTEEMYYMDFYQAEQTARKNQRNIWSIPGYVQEYGFSDQ